MSVVVLESEDNPAPKISFAMIADMTAIVKTIPSRLRNRRACFGAKIAMIKQVGIPVTTSEIGIPIERIGEAFIHKAKTGKAVAIKKKRLAQVIFEQSLGDIEPIEEQHPRLDNAEAVE